jgi:hypothetical protein
MILPVHVKDVLYQFLIFFALVLLNSPKEPFLYLPHNRIYCYENPITLAGTSMRLGCYLNAAGS